SGVVTPVGTGVDDMTAVGKQVALAFGDDQQVRIHLTQQTPDTSPTWAGCGSPHGVPGRDGQSGVLHADTVRTRNDITEPIFELLVVTTSLSTPPSRPAWSPLPWSSGA